MVQTEQMDLIPYEEGVYLQRDPEGGVGTTVFSFGDGEEQVYVYVARDEYSADDPNSPLLFSDADLGGLINRPRLFMPRIFPASKNENGEWECRLYMTDWGYELVDYKDLYYAGINEAEAERLYDKLSAGGMKVDFASSDRLRGTVELKDDEAVLFTTVPYDKGWEISVDGSKAESISLLDGAFLGVKLGKGVHEIDISFKNGWVLPGALCGVAGIFILAAFYLAGRRKRETV